jgi:hypothetical protein
MGPRVKIGDVPIEAGFLKSLQYNKFTFSFPSYEATWNP